MDAVIRHTICKHIHLVVRYNNLHAPISTNAKVLGQDAMHDLIQESHSLFLQTVEHEKQQSHIGETKKRILEHLCSLTAEVKQCTSTEGLLAAEKHIIYSGKQFMHDKSGGRFY